MGLLEYQAMSSLRNVARDEVLCKKKSCGSRIHEHYDHVEVSGHNLVLILEVFCMDFLNNREGGLIFYDFSYFFLYRNCKRLREFEEIKIASKAVEVTVNNKEENS